MLATLHTQSAAQTVDRVIDIFPPHQQQQIRAQLADRAAGRGDPGARARAPTATGRAVITEIMIATPAIRNLIREGKIHQIPRSCSPAATTGMLAFDQHLAERVRDQVMTFEQALEICHSPEEFTRLAGRM